MSPQRIQRRRIKGWRMPEGAAYVGRPSIWGNPFKIGDEFWTGSPAGGHQIWLNTADLTVRAYREALERTLSGVHWFGDRNELRRRFSGPDHARYELMDLRGKDLVCWCGPYQPCHADVLLELANAEVAS